MNEVDLHACDLSVSFTLKFLEDLLRDPCRKGLAHGLKNTTYSRDAIAENQTTLNWWVMQAAESKLKKTFRPKEYRVELVQFMRTEAGQHMSVLVRSLSHGDLYALEFPCEF